MKKAWHNKAAWHQLISKKTLNISSFFYASFSPCSDGGVAAAWDGRRKGEGGERRASFLFLRIMPFSHWTGGGVCAARAASGKTWQRVGRIAACIAATAAAVCVAFALYVVVDGR